MNEDTLYAGVARRDITPGIGTPLFGYAGQRRADSMADNLYVTLLFLSYNDETACLISVDWCLVEDRTVACLRRAVAAACEMPELNITIAATHTHSGPVTVTRTDPEAICPDPRYLATSEATVVAAAVDARASFVEVSVGIGTGASDVGINRRQITGDGYIVLGVNPNGPRDRDLTVIRLERTTDGRQYSSPTNNCQPSGTDGQRASDTLATLVHFGAHPTARGKDPAISRDWPGVMSDRMETFTGAPVVFLNGASGDVAPRTNTARAIGDGAIAAQEVGLRAASDALQVWRSIREFRHLPLELCHKKMRLPLSPLPNRVETEARLQALTQANSGNGNFDAEIRHLHKVLAEHRLSPCNAESFPALDWHQTITRLGPIVFVPFAGEIFTETAWRLKQLSPFAHTLCLGTCNGSHGYYVTREARSRGGYEVKAAFVNSPRLPYLLADDIDDVLVRDNLHLLESLDNPSVAGLREKTN